MSLETLIGKPHFDYKTYIEKYNIVVEAIDEIAFLSNTLDYERLINFFKEVIETFDYYKNIDENDDNSEGFSNMDNKERLLLNIIDCDEYNNLINFMETYRTTIIRKCDNLLDKIIELKEIKNKADSESGSESDGDKKNPYIAKDYAGNVELMSSKLEGIASKLLDNIESKVPLIDEKKLKFDIKIITKNDIICILSLYRSLKNLVYKQMHVLDREYYTATKEDVLAFRKELYKLYELICEYFNKNKNTYLEDISEKFQEVVELVENLEATEGGAVKAKVVATAEEATAKEATAKEADDEEADDEEEIKKLEKKMNDDNTEKTEDLDVGKKLIEDNKRLLQNELDNPLDRKARTRAAPEAPAAQLKEELNKNNTFRSPPKTPVVEEPINVRLQAEQRGEAHLNNSLSPTPTPQPQPPPKTPVDGATDAIKTQLEAQGKAVTDTAAQAQAAVEANLAQGKATIDAAIAKQKAVVDNLISPFASLTKQVGTKGANGEPVSSSRMFAQLAQSVLKQPNK